MVYVYRRREKQGKERPDDAGRESRDGCGVQGYRYESLMARRCEEVKKSINRSRSRYIGRSSELCTLRHAGRDGEEQEQDQGEAGLGLLDELRRGSDVRISFVYRR